MPMVVRQLVWLLGISLLLVTVQANANNLDQELAQLEAQAQSAESDGHFLSESLQLAEFRLQQSWSRSRSQLSGQSGEAELQAQLAWLGQYAGYLDKRLQALNKAYDKAPTNDLLDGIVRRYQQMDAYYLALLETLDWAEQAGIDTQNERAALRSQLDQRADLLVDYAMFSQQKLDQLSAKMALLPADQQSELAAQSAAIRSHLRAVDASLSKSIPLMNSLGLDTTGYQQALFTMTGDITQDVLSINLAQKLAKQWWQQAKSELTESGPGLVFKILVFVAILAVAVILSRVAAKLVRRAVKTSKLNFSQLLQDFFTNLAAKLVIVIGVLIGLSQLGLELGPLLAGFGIAGVIIGFALQDTLSNFASGMMILVYRPYDVGDLVIAAGVTGVVSHMSLVSTTIKTLDNQRLIIPNNKIWGDIINNITAENHRRIDMVFGISYSDDLDHAERVLRDIVDNHPKVLKSPEAKVKVHTLNNSSVDFVVRPWVKPEDYWDVHWDVTKAVKQRFDAEGISIPFPQTDVHLFNETKQS
ncbi:mechanosensitive ion channel family protein [Paraferrimonas sedimenticola]|uniref:Small-conductance mechanosensitive channel n=1 Tax=Paraferrimonas sedimenticola TaxID=375674 RepID=A0AA37VYZ4_9GAMM|nr:mechanosensitive ion channel domain-containing protein [Paraferrimonas sedimenticola]GLP97286.1 mechanosensitive ion channel protein [Paraferrimonas sedimenticola]